MIFCPLMNNYIQLSDFFIPRDVLQYWLISNIKRNEGESATSFCRQVAELSPDMFCNFYLVKNHKIGINSTTTKAIEKISKDL